MITKQQIEKMANDYKVMLSEYEDRDVADFLTAVKKIISEKAWLILVKTVLGQTANKISTDFDITENSVETSNIRSIKIILDYQKENPLIIPNAVKKKFGLYDWNDLDEVSKKITDSLEMQVLSKGIELAETGSLSVIWVVALAKKALVPCEDRQTDEEIAGELGKTTQTVRQIITRTYHQVSWALTEDGYESPQRNHIHARVTNQPVTP